jgi:photosystem II stability/assembly factor-like uncharacterized protein
MKFFSFILVLLALLAGPAVHPLAAAEGWVPLGPPGGDVSHLIVHSRNPQILWAGTPHGVSKSVDGGASWRPIYQGLLPNDRFVRALAVAPSHPDILYLATGGGPVRVYRSSDGGATWRVMLACGDDPPPCCGCIPMEFVVQLVVHPRNPQTVFAATYKGLFKSTDGGAQWRRTGLSDTATLSLAFDPQDPNTLYAGLSDEIRKSRNGGASWVPLRRGFDFGFITHLVVDPRNSRRIWAAGGPGVYRSTDGGASWKRSQPSLPASVVRALALTPAAGAGLPTLWAGNLSGVFRSLDGGATWRAALPNRSVHALATHPSRPATVWAGIRGDSGLRFPTGIYKSVNRGAVWTFSSRGLFEAHAFSLAFDPVTPGVLWSASLTGIWRSADNGATWTERSGNLPKMFFVWTVAVDPRDPETLWAGTNRGVYVSENGGATWEERREGLTGPGARPYATVQHLRIASADPSVVYALSNVGLFKTVDAGRHWTLLPAPPLPVFASLRDVWVDLRDPEVLFAAWGDLWVSRNGGASWDRVPVESGATAFVAVKADPRDPDVLSAAGAAGVFRSTDGGQAWQRVTDLPISSQGNLAVGPAGEVWAGDLGGIRFSPDGLSGWTLLPGLTPFHNLGVLEADPHHPGTVYAGTSEVFDRFIAGLFRHTGD